MQFNVFSSLCVRRGRTGAVVAALLLPVGLSWAASDRAAIQAQYNADRQVCLAMPADSASRAACLKEAGAARQAALRGTLSGSLSPAELERNALARCVVHQDAVDRAACERMVLGEGAAQGSVEAGGIFKEMVTPIDPR